MLLFCAALGLVATFVACDPEKTRGVEPPAADFTAYELSGSPDRPLVVMIHGVSGPMRVWDALAPALQQGGYRTLRYDLFGRGASGRPPEAAYDLTTYLPQLDALLAGQPTIEATRKVHLVGSSMGAIIASAWATAHPDRVLSLTLVGPAGFPLEASPLAKLMGLPGIGDWAMTVFGHKNLAEHNRRYFFAPETAPAFEALQTGFEAQLLVRGTKKAILRTVRNAPLQSFGQGYAEAGKLAVPKLVVWGKEDGAFPFVHHEALLASLPGARFLAVDAAGHLPQYEKPEIVGPAVLAFLNENPAGIISP